MENIFNCHKTQQNSKLCKIQIKNLPTNGKIDSFMVKNYSEKNIQKQKIYIDTFIQIDYIKFYLTQFIDYPYGKYDWKDLKTQQYKRMAEVLKIGKINKCKMIDNYLKTQYFSDQLSFFDAILARAQLNSELDEKINPLLAKAKQIAESVKKHMKIVKQDIKRMNELNFMLNILLQQLNQDTR